MDAVCGPSNALQQFQKHAQQDRTLQQDRLNLRQGPSQGFRSSPGPNAGLMDPEFEAFQAGMPTGPSHLEPSHMQHFAPMPMQSQFQPQAAIPDWASDFQNSQLAPVRPSSAHQIAAPVPIHAPAAVHNLAAASSWHTDFMQSQNMGMYEAQPYMAAEPTYMHNTQMNMGYTPMMSGMAPAMSMVAQGKQRQQESQDMFDMAAFERAFDDARLQMVEAEAMLQHTHDDQMENIMVEDDQLSDIERELQEETDMLAAQAAREMLWQRTPSPKQQAWPDTFMADQHRVLDEASNIVEEQQQQQPDKSTDDNELSIVAGQLLDSVSDNLSEKFQASSFLQLMRRLRDKELRVEGENFVETGTSTRSASPPAITIPTSSPNAVLERSERIAAALADLDADPSFHQDDSDMFRFSPEPEVLPVVEDLVVLDVPSRIPTPEIDPPAPTLDEWRQRVLGTPPPAEMYAFDAMNSFGA